MTQAAISSTSTGSEETLPRWDLSDLYQGPDCEALKQDIVTSTQQAEAFSKQYQSQIENLSGNDLATAIAEYETIQETLGRLGSFAYLYYAENMSDAIRAQFFQNISEALNDISTPLIFLTLELTRIEDKAMEEKLQQSTALRHYAPWIRDVRVYKPYQLSDELEKLLHEKSVTTQAWTRLFDETISHLRFPLGDDELTCTEILHLMSSKDSEKRKEAAQTLGKVLAENIRIFSTITNALAKDKAIEDKWRNLPKPISERNVSNFIEDDVVEALISSVKASYSNLSHRYYRLKAKWMDKDALDYWDRNAPLPQDTDRKIPWEEAVELVLTAYGNFSPQLRTLGEKFFDNDWIDVPPRDGKDSGAFAHPTVPSAHPYLLLNYQGKIRDVMTLAHELGHGVHQLLSAKQGGLMADTPLTLAETASVFGEQLTFRELLNRETDADKRKIIIAGKVEDMLNTVVRQVAFCEFERLVHDKRKEGEISTEELGAIWMQVQQESFGDAIRFDDNYCNFWSYIPHFVHSPFYVYSYAFGDCLVNALYAQYLEGMEGFEDKYFTMLEAGGTLHHKELLAPFDLDASDPAFWQKGLDIISGFIDELEG